ncbi:MAG: hypothetical protein MI723_19480, partial [Caulobacterales bacterium]|nr:hypothetical protein [Caulobacterales bacterium]
MLQDIAAPKASEFDKPPQFVVAIGASAGGLDALERLFPCLPATSAYAYVVVTHLSPEFKSLLDELLARRTDMPVHIVSDGAPIRGGNAYVLPAMKEMIAVADHLVLSDRDPNEVPHVPIDTFMRSLAREWGPRAVGIILSGSGSDGSRGVSEIKKNGGLVFAQTPTSARFTGMPDAAIDTGCVDQVLEPDRMGHALAAIPNVRPGAPNVGHNARGDTLDAEDRILNAIFGASDIDFSSYKTSTFERRVERRMAALRVRTVEEYAALVAADSSEARRLSDDLLIGVTEFFRDPDAFGQLRGLALTELVREKAKTGSVLRIWAPGCSTGQEAYSLAMLAREVGEEMNAPLRLQIFATDIHAGHLDTAGRGVYPKDELADLPDALREKYFFTAN